MYKHILISTDGSEVAQKGLDHGLALAKSVGAPVTIVTVTERFPVYADGIGAAYAMSEPMMAGYMASQKESANALLAAARQSAERLGVKVDTLHIEDEPPAEAILAAAKACNSDLIVMASHGRRGLGRLVLGSKTAEVVTHSPIPVLVVR